MVHRLLERPLTPEAHEKELNIIKEIAIFNRHSPTLTYNIIKNKKKLSTII